MNFKKILLFSLIILSVSLTYAQNFFLEGTITFNDSPVSNVYIYSLDHDFFAVTDSIGHYLLKLPNTYITGSLLISHVGFRKEKYAIPVSERKDTVRFNIQLVPLVYNLAEVTVSSNKTPTVKLIIERVKERIVKNYSPVINKVLNLSILESYINVANKAKLLEYNGEAFVYLSSKGSKGYKHEILKDSIDPNFFNYHIEMSPERFVYYIPINANLIISKTNKFSFYLDNIINYNGQDAYKIHFNLDRKYGGQKGFFLVNVSDYAILKIYYEYQSSKKLIAGKYKSTGIIYTDLISNVTEITYKKNKDGKYIFYKGSVNGLYKMYTKKKTLLSYSMDCDFSLKENKISSFNSVKLIPLKKLFYKNK